MENDRQRKRPRLETQFTTTMEMHPRNRYREHPPDFGKLAKAFKPLQPFVQTDTSGRSNLDFQNAEALRELTRALLKIDFGLDVSFPLDTLCPPVPNRLNYILWLEDLLKETQLDTHHNIIGIDIGVGASCIYPLLGCALHPDWTFVGTDISKPSVKYARKNVARNDLGDRISIHHNTDPSLIFVPEALVADHYTFCMCNPPFYASKNEIEQSLLNKEQNPSAVCTGSEEEMITQGGELGFIQRIIQQSQQYKTRIQWFTSMMGHKKTIKPVIQSLKEAKISNYIVTEFCQGRTKRWAIGWSFGSKRVVDAHSLDFYRPKVQFNLSLPSSVDNVVQSLQTIYDDLGISMQTMDELDPIILQGSPLANTWSRAARRARKPNKEAVKPIEGPTLFTFRCQIREDEGTHCSVTTSWVEGDDRALFESFYHHVKKRIEEACGIQHGSLYGTGTGK